MKIKDTVADMAQTLRLPAETLPGTVKITLTGRRAVLIEHHRGLLGYSLECVEVNAGSERVRVLGTALCLEAMDAETLFITGNIAAVEYG